MNQVTIWKAVRVRWLAWLGVTFSGDNPYVFDINWVSQVTNVSSNRMPSLTSSKSPLVGRYLFRTNAAGHWYDAHWPFKPGSRDAHWKRKPLEASPETSINLTLSQPSHWVSFVWSQLIMAQIPRVTRHLNLGLRIPTSSIIGDIIIFSFHIGFVAIFTRWALSWDRHCNLYESPFLTLKPFSGE